MKDLITGIQQVGIGVTDAEAAKHLYKDLFGMNVLIFEDQAEASLMTRYTGNKIHTRRAILSMNLGGGGGFEIWQYTSRTPTLQQQNRLGDLGIFATKIKCRCIEKAHRQLSTKDIATITEILTHPNGSRHFWLQDAYGNYFDIIESKEWFQLKNDVFGGVMGIVAGVSDMDQSVRFYSALLGIEEVTYQGITSLQDAPVKAQRGQQFNRVILKKQMKNKGAFCKLLGSIEIELVQALDFSPVAMFKDRYWGDCGFIHVCFDVIDMDQLKSLSALQRYDFTVDSSNSFSMGSSAGRFCYLEDPDGTLIELVETHKIPIIKKLNLHLNLKTRKNNGPLPDWMIGMLGLNRIR